MITASSEFKNIMRQPMKAIQMVVNVLGDNPQTFSSADVLASVDIEADGYFFGAATKSLTMKLIGTDYDLVGAEVKPTLKAQLEASSVEYEPMEYDTFQISEQTVDLEKGMTTLKGYDFMGVAANMPYTAGGLSWPCTVASLAEQVALKLSIPLATDMTTLPNYDYEIPEDLYAKISNTTYRSILAEIAGTTATICRITNGELHFVPAQSESVDELTYDNLLKVKLMPKYGKLSSVVLARTPQGDNIAVVDEETRDSSKNKNIFDAETILPLTIQTKSPSDATVVYDSEDNTLTITATSNDTFTPSLSAVKSRLNDGIYFNVEPNTNYTLSFSADTVANVKCLAYGYNQSTGKHTNLGNVVGRNILTFNSGAHTECAIRFGSRYNGTVTTFSNIQVEKGTSATPYEPFELNGIVEVKLANNEILDDNREAMAEPILNAVKGFEFYPSEANTEGHGWYECGDRVQISNGTNTYETVITHIKLSFSGGMKEELKAVAPDETQTNYALAGGITKTIYNTEIKVDKQGQEITSVVSRQDQFENQTLENFSQITQNISSVVTTIQTTGGGNLIHNSVGYNVDSNGNLANWTKTGTVSATSSPESVSYGALSGNQISLSASSSAVQRVSVSDESKYTLSFKAKKALAGNVTVHLRNDIDDFTVVIPADQTFLWSSFNITGVKPSSNYFDVVVEADANIDSFAITDLMLATGDSTTPWVSASDEILSKSVAVDGSGVTVKSSTNNDYVKLDEFGLNGYHGSTNVFKLQQDVTEVAKLKSRDQIEMPPIKIVPITSGNRAGWAFVKQEN